MDDRPDELPANFSNRIKTEREQAGLTQEQFATKLGVTTGAVGQWEIGKTRPSRKNLVRTAQILKIPLARLLGHAAELFTQSGPELEPVNIDRLRDAERFMIDTARKQGLNIYRVNSVALIGANIRPGDFLLFDPARDPRSRDIVLAEHDGNLIARVWQSPYLMSAPAEGEPETLIVDRISTRIRGVMVVSLRT